ncbi:acyltransferase family protein [Dryocola sp. BD626]|uniref:acyltransferase family protein n=1 Tax=Dryocola sp. BD626 TaxID=3133273 RepID=UPI003F50A21C
MNNNQNSSIQIGRGVAACIVAFSHLLTPQLKSINPESTILKYINLSFLGDFSVYFFFCISGYVMMLSCSMKIRGSISFLKDRIIRIYPLYITITGLALLVFSLTRASDGWIINLNYYPKTVYDYISVFTLFPPFEQGGGFAMPLATAWSLVYELYFYVVFALLLRFVKIKNIPYVIVVFLFLSFLIINSLFEPVRHKWVYWPYIISDFINLCFGLGCVLFLAPKPTQMIRDYSVLYIVIIVLGLMLLPRIYAEKLTFVIASSLCCYLLIHYEFRDGVFKKVFVYLGSASYSIYLSHILFNSSSWHVIKFGALAGLLWVLFAILVGCMIHSLVEKKLTTFIKTTLS